MVGMRNWFKIFLKVVLLAKSWKVEVQGGPNWKLILANVRFGPSNRVHDIALYILGDVLVIPSILP